MALHPRLGQDSPLHLMEENVLAAIMSHISFGFMAGTKIGGAGDPGIQEAVRQASDGDTLIVRAGVALLEWPGQLTVTKSLHITSEDIVMQASQWLDVPLEDSDFDDAPILRGARLYNRESEPEPVFALFEGESAVDLRVGQEVEDRAERDHRRVAAEGALLIIADRFRHRAAGPLRLHDHRAGLEGVGDAALQ